MKYQSGSLVSVRGRDWVVQPTSTEELLIIKPLDGNEDETTGILLALDDEQVKSTVFEHPKSDELGDAGSCRLFRDALKIGIRNSAGPFRCFGRIAVSPRPYQLVPLLMGLKLNPVRLLIADDVGVGKTIEACLLARELIDRGECNRLCVLCPPHLAEQWQRELSEKFHIEAKLVLPSTIRKLETECGQSESVFEFFKFTIVSLDFIKSDRRKEDFLRAAPDFIIVDEAHTVGSDIENSSHHQRYALVKNLCNNPQRHIVLVTATPHSGNEGAFRSLLGLLKPEFLKYPNDLSGDKNRKYRQEIAKYFVQRQRGDILYYLEDKTEFPTVQNVERQYTLSKEYRELFDRSLEYARELVFDKKLKLHHQRVRWWSALALLRALASSPAAAAATLNNRNVTIDASTADEADIIGQKMVFDLDSLSSNDAADMMLGSKIETDGEKIKLPQTNAAILRQLAADADKLRGEKDNKMLGLVTDMEKLLKDDFHPIIFCRFIQTAEYLAAELRERIKINDVKIDHVTGQLPPEERQRRVLELAEHRTRILVCTDCLSEGINLQEHFDAVIHYDLSWNPTRHEQREGRVDRFGQPQRILRMITYYGSDNLIDGVVLDVLLRKHKAIKDSLGISIPIPTDAKAIAETIFSSLLRKKIQTAKQTKFQEILDYLDDETQQEIENLHKNWDEATKIEKRSRTVFAQERFAKQVDEVRRELDNIKKIFGSENTIAQFTLEVLQRGKAVVKAVETKGQIFDPPVYEIDFQTALPRLKDFCCSLLRERTNKQKRIVRFDLPVESNVDYLCRTHPLVEALADYVFNTALDATTIKENSTGNENTLASRCGMIYTNIVKKRTTLLLLRFRFHLNSLRQHQENFQVLAEDVQVIGFRGAPDDAKWIDNANEIDTILNNARSTRNIMLPTAKIQIDEVLGCYEKCLMPKINDYVIRNAEELGNAHKRVREITSGHRVTVCPELPPDLLGVYIYLPE
ncbi:MAG: DEAD/DEAH box helicase [Planctomycetaceae bacterium]|jgi:superfamily II DNA or RNA helicase|nr:DEAD/DEAH box helicase [Planctomycetaceae bacterium]